MHACPALVRALTLSCSPAPLPDLLTVPMTAPVNSSCAKKTGLLCPAVSLLLPVSFFLCPCYAVLFCVWCSAVQYCVLLCCVCSCVWQCVHVHVHECVCVHVCALSVVFGLPACLFQARLASCTCLPSSSSSPVVGSWIKSEAKPRRGGGGGPTQGPGRRLLR